MPSYDPQALTNLLRMRQSRSRPRQGGGSLLAGLGQQAAKTVSQVFADRAARPMQMLKFATTMAQIDSTNALTASREQASLISKGEKYHEALNQAYAGIAAGGSEMSQDVLRDKWRQLLMPAVQAGFVNSEVLNSPPSYDHALTMTEAQIDPKFVEKKTKDPDTGEITGTQAVAQGGMVTTIDPADVSIHNVWVGGLEHKGLYNKNLGTWEIQGRDGKIRPLTGQILAPPPEWKLSTANMQYIDENGIEREGPLFWGGNPQKPYELRTPEGGRTQRIYPGRTSSEQDARRWGAMAAIDVDLMGSLLFGIPKNPATGQPFIDAQGNTLPPLFAEGDSGKGISFKLKMLWRRGKALIGHDPVMRTYMDWLAFNSGNMARAQQSGRPSDKDIEKVIMPAWPNPLWDDRISASLKINKLREWTKTMQDSGPALAQEAEIKQMANPETRIGSLVLIKDKEGVFQWWEKVAFQDEKGNIYEEPRAGDPPEGLWREWHSGSDLQGNPRGPYISPEEMGFSGLNYQRDGEQDPASRPPIDITGSWTIEGLDADQYLQNTEGDWGPGGQAVWNPQQVRDLYKR